MLINRCAQVDCLWVERGECRHSQRETMNDFLQQLPVGWLGPPWCVTTRGDPDYQVNGPVKSLGLKERNLSFPLGQIDHRLLKGTTWVQ